MTHKVCVKTYRGVEANISEIARYSGARETDDNLIALINSCIAEGERENAAVYSVCYSASPLNVSGDVSTIFGVQFKSKNLAAALYGCDEALVFACTMGIGIDRLIKKYSEVNPSRALIFQAYGAERIESFTDRFLSDYAAETGKKLAGRFSPGYGDLPLEAQRDVFALLNPEKRIGVTLNDGLLMSPSKSVTAIAGIGKSLSECDKNACENCLSGCEFKR